MKIVEQIVDQRLREVINVTPNQCGLVKNSPTTGAIHTVRLLTEKHREKHKIVHATLLDLEKAFDRHEVTT